MGEHLLSLEGDLLRGEARQASKRGVRRHSAQRGSHAIRVFVPFQHEPGLKDGLEAQHRSFYFRPSIVDVPARHDQRDEADRNDDAPRKYGVLQDLEAEHLSSPRQVRRDCHPSLNLGHQHTHVERLSQVIERARKERAHLH